MDKLEQLKCQLIDAYASLVRMAQRGYPISDYCDIREAMLAINYIENFTVDSRVTITVLDRYAYKLSLRQ